RADRQHRRGMQGAVDSPARRAIERPLHGLDSVPFRRPRLQREVRDPMRGMFIVLGVCAALGPGAASPDPSNPSARFSDISDITPANVSQLTLVWTAHTG